MVRITMINTIKHDIAGKYEVSNFEKCSLDDAKSCSLITNKALVIYDFDLISEEISKSFGSGCLSPKSLDSIYLELKDRLCFIEFKNSKWTSIDKDAVKMKIYETLSLLSSYYRTNFEIFTYSKIFIIHKHEPKNSSAARKRLNGTCPDRFRLLEEMFKVKIVRYDALDFEEYLTKYNKLPV